MSLDINERIDLEDEEQECAEEYVKGGYHLVRIGDTLCGKRYKVIRKLGWGVFSTVWLCLDAKYDEYVAIKIVKSKKSFRESAIDEIEMLSDIRSADPSDPFSERIVTLVNHFSTRGVNGRHICLAFEVMGDSLYRFINSYYKNGVPIEALKSIIRQVLEGLDYLHTKCGLIHTDIKPENILLTIDRNRVKLMHSEVIQVIGVCGESQLPKSFVSMAPRDQVISDDNLRPTERNQNITEFDLKSDNKLGNSFQGFNENLSEISVKIADLGNACYVYENNSSTIQTRNYRSPEVILGSGYGTSADIWSTACLAFELATGQLLFDPHETLNHSRNEVHLARIVELLGPIPKSCRKGKHYNKYFHKSGRLLRIKILEPISIETVLSDQYGWHRTEAIDFAQFLLPMLSIDCRKRATAYECLSHPWINS